MHYFCITLVQYDQHLVSIMDTDGLVLWHQAISSHIAEKAGMCFQLLMG